MYLKKNLPCLIDFFHLKFILTFSLYFYTTLLLFIGVQHILYLINKITENLLLFPFLLCHIYYIPSFWYFKSMLYFPVSVNHEWFLFAVMMSNKTNQSKWEVTSLSNMCLNSCNDYNFVWSLDYETAGCMSLCYLEIIYQNWVPLMWYFEWEYAERLNSYFLNFFFLRKKNPGAPGWFSQLSVYLWLSSWSQPPGIQRSGASHQSPCSWGICFSLSLCTPASSSLPLSQIKK